MYIEGFRYKDEVNKTGYTGHAWVIDGVGVRRRKVECFYGERLIGRDVYKRQRTVGASGYSVMMTRLAVQQRTPSR